MRRLAPVILTACGVLACGVATPAAASTDDPPAESTEPASPATAFQEGVVGLASPLPLRIEDLAGKTYVGKVDRFDDDGLYGAIGFVRWVDLKPADRFRIGRSLLSRARREDVAGLAWLVYMLEATRTDAFRDRAVNLLIAAAGDDADAWLAESSRRAQELLDASAALAAASEAARFRRG